MLDKFNGISEKTVELYGRLLTDNFKATQEVYDKAINLYSEVGQFIEALEAADENLDPEKTKIPDLDQFFTGNPVTEYINELYNLITGTGRKDLVQQAAQKLATYQNKPKEMSLADYVTQYGFGTYDPNEMLNVIQEILDRRRNTFTQDDLKLIRFYLKQKPFNEPEDIDSLSDRALELAWKRFKFMRTVK